MEGANAGRRLWCVRVRGHLPGAGAPLARCDTFLEALPTVGTLCKQASLTFFSNTHSSLAPASPGASGAGPAGTFFPWEQNSREGGKGADSARGMGGGDPAQRPLCFSSARLLCCPSPSRLHLNTPSQGHRRACPCGEQVPALTGPKPPFYRREVEEGPTAPVSWSSARSPWEQGPRRWGRPGAACSRPQPRWCPACGQGSPGGSWEVLGWGHSTGQRQGTPEELVSRCFISEA